MTAVEEESSNHIKYTLMSIYFPSSTQLLLKDDIGMTNTKSLIHCFGIWGDNIIEANTATTEVSCKNILLLMPSLSELFSKSYSLLVILNIVTYISILTIVLICFVLILITIKLNIDTVNAVNEIVDVTNFKEIDWRDRKTVIYF